MSKSKQKGTAFETLVLGALKSRWPDAERRALRGVRDAGDFVVPGWTLEAKNQKRMAMAEWMKEAEKEALDNTILWAVVHKARGKGDPLDQMVTMTLRTFLRWA